MTSSDWLALALSFAAGLFSGLVTRVFAGWYHRVASRVNGALLRLDPEEIRFFTLDRWSPARPLTPDLVETNYDGTPWSQDWCDPVELDALRARIDDTGGGSASLRMLRVDDRESRRGQHLALTFARSNYEDLIAVGEYFKAHPERVSSVLARLRDEETSRVIAGAPPSVVSINVTVTSADGRLLAIRRSGSVRTSQNVWTLGPNETMREALPISGGIETPHELARRCLDEEIGLRENRIERLDLSWLGYNVPGALLHLVAHCRSSLRSEQITELIAGAHSIFELDVIDWLPANRTTLKEIVRSVRDEMPDAAGRKWLDSSALAAAEWQRWGSLLRD